MCHKSSPCISTSVLQVVIFIDREITTYMYKDVVIAGSDVSSMYVILPEDNLNQARSFGVHSSWPTKTPKLGHRNTLAAYIIMHNL